MRHRALLIGAGQIAAGYDGPSSAAVLTHAHALHDLSDDFATFIFDVDSQKSKVAAGKWGMSAVSSREELDRLSNDGFDLVVNCVPDRFHLQVLEQILDLKPRLVIAEKPLTLTAADSRAIVTKYQAKSIPLWINFQRRYDVSVLQVRDSILDGTLGALVSGTFLYSKGLLHNGAHALDLLLFLLGNASEAVKFSEREDYSPNDLNADAGIHFKKGWVHFVAGDERAFSLFELDLIFEKRRFRFWHSGLQLEVWEPKADTVFAGYTELSPTPTVPTQLGGALTKLYADVLHFLRTGRQVGHPCLGADAVRGQEIAEVIARAPRFAKIDLLDQGRRDGK